jgi:phosphoglycerate kinase
MPTYNVRTLDDIDVSGKRVLYRAAYDIALIEGDGVYKAENDSRISGTLPTLRYLLEKGCAISIVSWLNRPDGKVIEKYRMGPVADKLSELLKVPIQKLNDCVGPDVTKVTQNLKPREVVLLENTRFHAEEQAADQAFAKELAKAGEVVVYDAFAQSHRIHASTTGILRERGSAVGFLMKNELDVLTKIIENPMRPFVVVVGGAKISDKLAALKNVLPKCDMILVGGALANMFSKARGFDVGGSFLEGRFVDQAKESERDPLESAKEVLAEVGDNNTVSYELIPEMWPNGEQLKLYKMQLPFDAVVARKIGDGRYDADTLKLVKINGRRVICAEDEAILDIGPVTRAVYGEIIKRARTIFWNGPMGLFEDFDFCHGTQEISKAIAGSNGYSVIGGGDTELVVDKFNMHGQFGHVSSGGGASFYLLAGNEFPVLKYLMK